MQGRLAEARDTLDEAVALWGDRPELTWCKVRSMIHLGLTYHALGDYEGARSIQTEALRLAQEVQDYSFIPVSQCHLAFHQYAQGELALAKEGFATALIEAQRFSLLSSVAHSIVGLGLVAAAEGLASRAVTLLTFGLALPGAYINFFLGEPQRGLAELRAELRPVEFAAADARARKIDLAELLAWL